jgi:hypothetical protein
MAKSDRIALAHPSLTEASSIQLINAFVSFVSAERKGDSQTRATGMSTFLRALKSSDEHNPSATCKREEAVVKMRILMINVPGSSDSRQKNSLKHIELFPCIKC